MCREVLNNGEYKIYGQVEVHHIKKYRFRNLSKICSAE
jgi:hypothetical protein